MGQDKLGMLTQSARLFGLACTLSVAVGCGATPTPLSPGIKGSVGAPHNGVLTTSDELPRSGPGYVRFRQRGSAYHALPRLVKAIKSAAKSVDESFPGSKPLVVGDLSAKTGGKVPRHNSHRSGRDVDLLFFVVDQRGVPYRNDGFYPLGADGFVQFPNKMWAMLDLPRQWHLIRHLLQNDEIEVQFMFMSRDLEARIIDYALAKETNLELLWRAQTVMLQPTDSLPHADHIHLRIACTPEETVHGCLGGGPRFQWFPPLPALNVEDNDAEMAALFDGESEPTPVASTE